MGRHDLRCAHDHRTERHRVRGRLLAAEIDADSRVNGEDGHDPAPHAQDRLSAHVRTWRIERDGRRPIPYTPPLDVGPCMSTPSSRSPSSA